MPSNRIYDNMSVMRKCVLITNPTVSAKTNGLPYVLGQDTNGAQFNIYLGYLPPNVSLSQIKQGQNWWIERKTTEWTLLYSVGEFNPYSYSLFNSTKNWSPSSTALEYVPIVYDKVVNSVSSSMGSIVSDPTTGVISVPIPGLYDVTVSARTTSTGRSNSTPGYYGSFFDTTTQLATNAFTAYVVNIGTKLEANGISRNGGNSIVFENQGTYNIQFSAQLLNKSNSISNVGIWLREGNLITNPAPLSDTDDIKNSAGTVAVTAKHGNIWGQTIVSWNYVQTFNSNDFIQLIFATDTGSSQVGFETLNSPYILTPNVTTTGSLTTPDSPSLILTVQEAGTLQGSNGQLGLQIVQPKYPTENSTILSGPWSSPTTGTSSSDAIPIVQQTATLVLTKENLSFYPQAAWGGSSTDISINDPTNTYLSVAYRGPVA